MEFIKYITSSSVLVKTKDGEEVVHINDYKNYELDDGEEDVGYETDSTSD